MSTSYTSETPWLCWVGWPEAQRYRKANPDWVALSTSLRTDPEYRSIWLPHGPAGLGLINALVLLFAERSVSGIAFGAPEYLQGDLYPGLTLPEPPDLSWLLEAGWIRYISLAEKKEIEDALTASREKAARKAPARHRTCGQDSESMESADRALSKGARVPRKGAVAWLGDLLKGDAVAANEVKTRAAEAGYSRRAIQRAKAKLGVMVCRKGRGWVWQLPAGQVCQDVHQPDQDSQSQHDHPSPKTAFSAPRTELDQTTVTGTETGTDTETEIASVPSGAPFTNNISLAAIAAPPKTETGQRRPQRQPEAQQRPEKTTGNAQTLALVPDLPQPISALLGLRRDSAALPPESDALGKGRALRRNPSPTSFRRPREPGFLAGCLGPLSMAKQCPEVWDWVSSVFKLLRFSFDINSVEGRRETGSFSAMYNRVMLSPLPLGKKTEILVSSLKTAEQKGRKPDSHYRKGKGAVFCDILNQRLDRHLATQSSTANENHQPPKATPDPMRATG